MRQLLRYPPQARSETTQGLPTLQHLKHSTCRQQNRRKMRTRNKTVYRYEGEQQLLYHRFSDKPVLAIEDRPHTFSKACSHGRYDSDATPSIVQNHYWWWGLKDQTKDHVRSCATCKIGLAKFNELYPCSQLLRKAFTTRMEKVWLGPHPIGG